MRTYDRDAFIKATQLWDAGEFGWRWQAIRRIAAERGFLYPPVGDVHDDRDAEQPSQRAIIYRALEDNPGHVEVIVRRSWSWFDVVDGIIGLEARLAADLDEELRDDAWRRKDEPGHRDSTMSIKAILNRIADS